MEYDALVQNIYSCKLLKKALDEMVNRTRALNLVAPDWKTKLDSHPAHTLHLENRVKYSKGRACSDNKAYVRNVALAQEQYNIIVTGVFAIDANKKNNNDVEEVLDYSFITRKSEPLNCIATAMKETPLQSLHDGARFFVESCEPKFCYRCRDSYNDFKIPIPERNWCVLSTRVFDGHQIANEFKSTLIPSLLKVGKTLAIFNTQIYTRTTFGDNVYKIGGKIKEMILFSESAINTREELNFAMKPNTNQPAIEYPEEVEEAIPDP